MNVAQIGQPQQQTVAAHSQPVSRAVPQAAPPPADDHESSDWGLEPARSGISRENKFILFVLLVLVAVFSFVVFRNFQKKQNGAKAEVAGKDGKPDEKGAKKEAKAGDNKKSESEVATAPPLQEPGELEMGAENELAAGTQTKPRGHRNSHNHGAEVGQTPAAANPSELSDDPFGAGAAASETASNVTDEAPDIGQSLTENAPQEQEAPPQMQAGVAEEAPQQATELFEAPVQGTEVAQEPEIAEAAPTAKRGKGHSHQEHELVAEAPSRVNEPMQADPMNAEPMNAEPMAAEPMQQPAEIADFSTAETPAESTLAQTAGTAAEPIHRRGTTPRAAGIETAQAPVPNDPLGATPDTFTPTTAPRTTTPRATTPRATTPRNAPPAVPTPPVTQPRGNTPPPPLDPSDERLGGYREAPLPVAPNHRTASRPQPAALSGQFNPSSEPLVANVGEYIVRPNDNYWRISRKVYGTARYFAALAKHNEATIPDPRHMKPGIKISTPSKEQLEQQYSTLLPVMAAPRPVGAVMHSPSAPKSGYYVENGQPAYRIGPNDTLSTISKKTLGRATRWDEIYELNKGRINGPDDLAVGAILLLPTDASQTQVVGKPVEHR